MYFVVFLFWLALAGLVGYVASERNRSAGGWALISFLFSPIIGFLGLIAAGDAEPKKKYEGDGPIPMVGGKHGNTEKRRECLRQNRTPFPASHQTCPCCGNSVDDGKHPFV
jgi:hypothetical protein